VAGPERDEADDGHQGQDADGAGQEAPRRAGQQGDVAARRNGLHGAPARPLGPALRAGALLRVVARVPLLEVDRVQRRGRAARVVGSHRRSAFGARGLTPAGGHRPAARALRANVRGVGS
jgi:hypothetical protein